MKCLRCAEETPRRSLSQVHCLPCAAEVAALIAADEARRQPRQVGNWRPIAKDFSRMTEPVL